MKAAGPVPYLDLPGGPLQYIDVGGGEPFVIIHGTPGGCDQGLVFGKQLRLDSHRLLCPSRPGYLGTPLGNRLTPPDQARLIDALLETLGIGQATLIGISGGGPCAVHLAANNTRFRKLILLSAATKSWPVDQRSWRFNLLTKLLRSGPPSTLLSRLGRCKNPRWAIYSTLTPASRRRDGLDNDLMQFESLPPLPFPAILIPTLILHGSKDTTVQVDHARFANSQMARSELVELPGGTHDLVFTHREFLTERIRAFLST